MKAIREKNRKPCFQPEKNIWVRVRSGQNTPLNQFWECKHWGQGAPTGSGSFTLLWRPNTLQQTNTAMEINNCFPSEKDLQIMDFPFPYLNVGLLEGITLTVHFRGRHSTVHSISYAPFIWVNHNISLTWIKAIWAWFQRSQWGRYNLPRFIIILWGTCW